MPTDIDAAISATAKRIAAAASPGPPAAIIKDNVQQAAELALQDFVHRNFPDVTLDEYNPHSICCGRT